MKVVIFGATGMVGKGVLLECLDARVERVLIVSRHPVDVRHPKICEIAHQDFFDFSSIQSRFADADACFFCLGVSSGAALQGRLHVPTRLHPATQRHQVEDAVVAAGFSKRILLSADINRLAAPA
jgi:uncharacterized protein YbjT (DUF2867 family)